MKKQIEYLQRLFYDLWNDFGKVYLLVKHSDNTVIGKRGFTEEEKKNGIVLVFNNRTNKKMEWDEEGNVSCVLAFGTGREDVYIHHDDLLGVFSPEAGVQFVRSDAGKGPETAPEEAAAASDDKRVVSLSTFKRKKK
jgi:hypothetical protein